MAAAQQAARITDPVTHGLGLLGIVGGMLIGAVAGAILIAALPVTAPALVVGLTVAAAAGAVAGGGLAGHQLLEGIQRACALPSPQTGIIGVAGSPNVRIVSLPAARVIVDMAVPCHGLFSLYHLPIPPIPPAPIAEGVQTIRINNFLAARVTNKVVCGASIKQGAMTVYYGGPTQRVLAVFDLESMLLSALGFLAKASLIAMAVLTIPLGVGAMATFAAMFGGFMGVNYGLGVLGDRLGPGWRNILQGGFGLIAIVGGAKLGARSLGKNEPQSELRTVKIDDLNYSQGSVSPNMRDGRTINEVANDMAKNGWDTSKDPPDVVERDDGSLATLDHRRVVAAERAGLDEIPANVHPANESIDPETAQRFRLRDGADFTDPDTGKTHEAGDVPENWGEAARFRSANQRVMGYPDFPLRGSPDLPEVQGEK